MLSTIQSNTSSRVFGAIAISVFCGADNPAAFSASPIATRRIAAAIQNTAAAPTSSLSACNPRRNPSSSAKANALHPQPPPHQQQKHPLRADPENVAGHVVLGHHLAMRRPRAQQRRARQQQHNRRRMPPRRDRRRAPAVADPAARLRRLARASHPPSLVSSSGFYWPVSRIESVKGKIMDQIVIVSGVRTPVGKFQGSLSDVHRHTPRRGRGPRSREAREPSARADRRVHHGQRRLRRARPESRAPGRSLRRAAARGQRRHREHGLRLRPSRRRARRAVHPDRQLRNRRRGRHGVDDERALSAPSGAQRLSHGQRRPPSTRWSTTACGTSTTTSTWARPPSLSRRSTASRAKTRTASRCCRTRRPRPPGAKAASPPEVVPVEIPAKKKGQPPTLFERDESVREDASIEALRALKPAFKKDGTVTAGNAPGVNDAAAAVVIMSATGPASLA